MLPCALVLGVGLLCAAALPVPAQSQTTAAVELSKTGIPHVLHQIWRDEGVPVRLDPYMRSWARLEKKWTVKLWTLADARELIAYKFYEHLAMYDELKSHDARSEFARYCIMREYGGVYADLDVEIVKPMDDLLDQHSLILGKEPFEHAHILHNADYVVSNAIIASVPGHTFWQLAMIRTLSQAVGEYSSVQARVPGSLPIFVALPNVFYPEFHAGSRLRAVCDQSSTSQSHRVQSSCNSLKATKYRNHNVGPESYTIKHWIDFSQWDHESL